MSEKRNKHLLMLEAILFATDKPLKIEALQELLPREADVEALIVELDQKTRDCGFHLSRIGDGWRLQTAPEFSALLKKYKSEPRKLSQAALETLAIIAYHQPVSRAEIEAVRGVSVSGGTLDILMEVGWIRLCGRRRVPGRPITYGVTSDFLEHFCLNSLADLPGKDELKAMGLLDFRVIDDIEIPVSGRMNAEEEENMVESSGDNLDESFHTDYLQKEKP